MVVVITSWRPGGTSYMSGQRWGAVSLRRYTGMGMLDAFPCRTTASDPFKECACFGRYGPGYITQSCYNSLNAEDKAAAPSLFGGIIANSGYYVFGVKIGRTSYYKFNPDSIIPFPADDPCKDVSCPDKCVGVDKYDQVCQDGICVRGTLIETNSEHCGYTPEPEPDPTPTPSSDTYIVIALMLAGTYLVLRR